MTTSVSQLRARIDRSDMLGRVLTFPEQMEAAWGIGALFARSLRPGRFQRVVVCGMGGSAIGGDLARSFLGERLRVPLLSCRDYALPRPLAQDSLVVVSTYSGNTAETLAAYDAARGVAAEIVAITSGGVMRERCRRDGVPCCEIPGGAPPRAAIGFSLLPMLHILRATGAADFDDGEFHEALSVARERCAACGPDRTENAALSLARTLHGRTPFVYSAPGLLEGVARRWACQFNENAKTLAHLAAFPELHHNEIVGWEVGEHLMPRAVVLSLEDPDDHPMTRRQAGIALDIVRPFAAQIERVESGSGGRLARMLGTMLLGDFASVYLAYFNGVDPTPVAKIDALKRELARSSS